MLDRVQPGPTVMVTSFTFMSAVISYLQISHNQIQSK